MKIWESISCILKILETHAKVGVNLLELEKTAEELLKKYDVKSANKGYHPEWALKPFPSVLCLGVNNVIAHGYPYDYVLKSGDLLIIDIGIKKGEECADAGLTVGIGEVSKKDRLLMEVAKQALYEGIKYIKADCPVDLVSQAIYTKVLKSNHMVNKQMTGHGIGKVMHQEPTIHNWPVGNQQLFKEGEIVCIEPMVVRKNPYGVFDKDRWTLRQDNNSKVAMYEHMIKVTKEGYEILTSHI